MDKKACAEVYQIIQYLSEEEYKCIPTEYINFLKNNMDTTMKKIYTIETDFDDIKISSNAQIIFWNLYYNFIANQEQKIKIKNILINEENKKLENYYNKMFDISKEEYKDVVTTEMTVISKENIFLKIKKKIQHYMQKLKNIKWS